MPSGYAGKFLDVNLTKRWIKDIALGNEALEMFFGGRGLAEDTRTGKARSEVRSTP